MPLTQIHDRAQHDSIVTPQASIDRVPMVIYVTSSANPRCRALTTPMEDLSDEMTKSSSSTSDNSAQLSQVQWYQMELTPETTPMIKFGPQNTPIVILMRGKYCETLLGVRSVEEVRGKVQGMMALP